MARRIRLLLALAAVSAGVGFAQEKSVPVAGPTDTTAIEAAKREFQALKATRAAAEQAKIELPNVTMPSLPTGTVAPTGVSKNGKKEKSAQEKSKNWLLDAMEQTEKNVSTTSERKRGGKSDAQDGVSDDLLTTADSDELKTPSHMGELRDRAGKTSLKENPEATTTQAAPPKDNPLAPYMTGWISPRDHAVLLPKTTDTPMLDASLSQLVGASGTPLSGASPVSPTPASVGFSATFESASSSAGKTVGNPYLQLNLPAPPPAAAGPTLPSPGGLLPSPAVSELKPFLGEPPPPAKPALAPVDLNKPPQDAKYFPQLKRF